MRGTPQRRSRHPNRADRPATRRSHHAASSMPPATHQPSTAAITGLDSWSRVGPRGPDGRSRGRSTRSAPAQKACSSPVSTATRSAGSWSKAMSSSCRRSAVGLSMALRRCGRSMRMTVTPSGSSGSSLVTGSDASGPGRGPGGRRAPLRSADAVGRPPPPPAGLMRVVAGSARGLRLVAPPGTRHPADHRPGAGGDVQRPGQPGRGDRGPGPRRLRRQRRARHRGPLAGRRALHLRRGRPRRPRRWWRPTWPPPAWATGPRWSPPTRPATSPPPTTRWDLVLLDPPHAGARWPDLLGALVDRVAEGGVVWSSPTASWSTTTRTRRGRSSGRSATAVRWCR